MSFCVLPWKHLATHPHGGVSLCCRVDFADGVGMAYNQVGDERHFLNLNEDAVVAITNSDSFNKARAEMLSDQWPKACLGCKKEEDAGLKSKRQRENEVLKFDIEQARLVTGPDGQIQPDFQYLELRLGNLCNLKCRTCNPFSSSKWRTEYSVLEEALPFVRRFDRQAQFKWAEDEAFWAEVLESSKNLKMLFINGGEPTLIQQHWDYLEKLIDLGLAGQVEIKYNINMTQMPEKAFRLWKQFKSVLIGASVDDLGERNTYIRHGANWNTIEKHLELLQKNNIQVAIEQTVSIMNVYHLDEVEKYCHRKGLGYGLNFVYDPDYLAVDILPTHLKSSILNKLKKGGLSDRWWNHVNGIISREPENQPKLWNQFLVYTNKLDQLRSEKFSHIYPEYSRLIDFDPNINFVVKDKELSC